MIHDNHRPDTIFIIGAGIAGLACAKELQAAGKNVIILEAKERIGGRIHSIKKDSHTFDLGASWIHGIENNPIWEITQNNNIATTIFNYMDSSYYHTNGQVFSEIEQQEFELYIGKISQLLTESKQHSALEAINDIMASLEYSETVFPKKQLRTLLLSFFERLANDPFATDLSQLSAHYEKYEGYFEGDEVIFPEGYIQVIESISKNLNIQTDTEILKINLKDDHIELIDQHNKRYLGSRVIVAVPLGILKKDKITFSPSLPAPHLNAIQNMGFGSFNKVFMEFEELLPFNLNTTSTNISDFYWHDGHWFNILNLTNIYKKPMYLMLFGGKQSEYIDDATDAEVWNFIYKGLNKTFSNIPNRPKNIIITRWGADQQSYGSFSFPTPLHTSELVETLNQPIKNRLFFIGEHCSLKYAGTVHGAYLTGQETSQKILDETAQK
ncbi:flavin monoamine oxidase family protein [Acinetobacter sp. ANC 4648]|uniref:flavin monoamine oxidase family protein n=1 Tax=Acinetobacter sp. ANC 4648 TaxID=1977875 RepID=UPI000A334788|nr:NAD(P)/FAD-dependent oxidoreductase [Acinetobacter sp. ANC 4648]OTG83702.1 hypothetical protein B9T27_04105 [Acinetobacter sp. ANC 4648]